MPRTKKVQAKKESAQTETQVQETPKENKNVTKDNVAIVYEGSKERRRYEERHGDFKALAEKYVAGRPKENLRIETTYIPPAIICPSCGHRIPK